MRHPGRMHSENGPEQFAEKHVAVAQGRSRFAVRLALKKLEQEASVCFHAETARHARDALQTLIGRILPAQHHAAQPEPEPVSHRLLDDDPARTGIAQVDNPLVTAAQELVNLHHGGIKPACRSRQCRST